MAEDAPKKRNRYVRIDKLPLHNSYLGNINLPRAGAEFDYTPEQIADIKLCKENILYFAEKFFHIVSLDEGKQTIKLYDCQKRALKKMIDSRFFVLLASRQVGKTSIVTIYALWVACFQDDQSILIVANKEKTAIEIYRRVRLAYEGLPNWLKPGVKDWGKTGCTLANGTLIGISTTTGSAARGLSINLLLLDELAHIEPGMVDEFWKSVYPIVSSSKKSKILAVSTANGTGNLFHSLYSGAEAGTNGWNCDKILWNEIPGRDENWKKQTIATIGSTDAFNQEFQCCFLESNVSSIDSELFERLNARCCAPKYTPEEGYSVWEEPNDERLYTVGVDVAEGVNKDASDINIFDITELTSIRQVANYHNNTMAPFFFADKVHEILQQWGKPIVCVERNGPGAQVVDRLRHVHNYENIVSWGGAKNKTAVTKVLGIQSHTNTKYAGVVNMQWWVNHMESVEIRDKQLLAELKTFARRPNSTWGSIGAGTHDDRVMSTIWGLIILHEELVNHYFEVVSVDANNRPLILKALDYGIKYFTKPKDAMKNITDDSSALPIAMGIGGADPANEIDQMKADGWTFHDPYKY